MKPTVFIHTNHKQLLGAKVSEYSLRKASRNGDKFDIRIINLWDFPTLHERLGQSHMRRGHWIPWDNEDLQSFTPLRFLAPQLMDYQGRAVVIDPDIFAVGDIYDLLSSDMEGKAIRVRHTYKYKDELSYLTSVMLLDCAKLEHWRWEESLERMFSGELDYDTWIRLKTEPPDTIGKLEANWNSLDAIDDDTKLLHFTRMKTQPWKTGLPIEYKLMVPDPPQRAPAHGLSRLIPWLNGLDRATGRKHDHKQKATLERYLPHPDPRLSELFFSLLGECLAKGIVHEDLLRDEIKRQHVRSDIFEVLSAHAA